MLKRRLHIVLGTTCWLMVIAGVVMLFFTGMRTRHFSPVRQVWVHISGSDGTHFISEHYIRGQITSAAEGKSSSDPSRVNLRKVESMLLKEPWIREANLYVDNNQAIHADIVERTPVARVFHADGTSRYLDEFGYLLPLSTMVREDLPVFTGLHFHPGDKVLSPSVAIPLVQLATLLQKDTFWQMQAAQIEVVEGSKFIMYPSVGSHEILLGDSSMLEDKLNRLRIFYKQVYAKQRPDKYSILNASFSNQLVAVLQSKEQVGQADSRAAFMLKNQLVEREKREAEGMAIENTADRGRIVKDIDDGEKRTKQEKPSNSLIEKPEGKPSNEQNKPKALLPPNSKNN